MSNNLTIVQDHVDELLRDLQRLSKSSVLVGVPEDTTSREEGEATNALIAYVHEVGSPARNIPARPFLVPGIEKAKREITSNLYQAAAAAVNGDSRKARGFLEITGQVARDSVKNEIRTGNFAPLSPETIRNRRRQRGTTSMRKSEVMYLNLIAKGVPPDVAQQSAGIQPLINTGALLSSIQYVIRNQ